MTREEIKIIESSLFEFIQRAAQEDARPEEVAVLPGAVSALISLSQMGPND